MASFNIGTNTMAMATVTADELLRSLDSLAETIEDDHEKWDLEFEQAKVLVNSVDEISDKLELATYGEESMERRKGAIFANSDSGRERSTWVRPTAKTATLVKKANLCVEIASMMLPDACEDTIENQALSLMYLPAKELLDTHERLKQELGLSDKWREARDQIVQMQQQIAQLQQTLRKDQ